ncbi:DUF2231 domain-containing protein [Sulfurimonas sp.]|uniref:DUF2231 domain-containing protein n=1 Tax=Sulfurimonas sp. TaxID=2022749 RepID=UPI00356403DE
MLHPAIAHFAISLPIISLILGIAYLYKPNELMSKISSRFFVFAALFIIAAYFTGKHDGSEVFMSLGGEGRKLLLAHKDLGLYITIAMAFAAIIKFYGCQKQNKKVEIVSVVLVALIAAGVLYQGKMGGELTFTHGAHVKDHAKGLECIDDPEEYLDSLAEDAEE